MIQNHNVNKKIVISKSRARFRWPSTFFANLSIPLLLVTLVDFIVRSAYMTGKTPVLPLFAATLGAGEILLGLISSISAFTGMALKPIIGALSDRQGRRYWLIAGALFFVGMPFLYRFITTPEQLIVIRLIHGISTAIYGPVTMAMVVEMGAEHRATRVGFFSLGRTGGYIVGPALGGFLLLRMDPAAVYTIIGLMSCVALIPLFYLPETGTASAKAVKQIPLFQQLRQAIGNSAATPAIWIASGFEAMNYMVTYSAKAFLPIYALAAGRSTLEAGLFFSIQQGVTMGAKPLFGWLGDRWSHLYTIVVALFGMSGALWLLTSSSDRFAFFGAAILLGLSEALIIPAATALIAVQIKTANLGAGLGIVGMLSNASKVMGPILAGFAIAWVGYEITFQLMGLLVMCGGGLLLYSKWRGWLRTKV